MRYNYIINNEKYKIDKEENQKNKENEKNIIKINKVKNDSKLGCEKNDIIRGNNITGNKNYLKIDTIQELDDLENKRKKLYNNLKNENETYKKEVTNQENNKINKVYRRKKYSRI